MLLDNPDKQIMEDLAMEVPRESSTDKIIVVTSAVALAGVSLLASIVYVGIYTKE